MLDTHHYEVFNSSALEMSVQDHISTACQFGDQMTSSGHSTIAGEYCGAMTDCAKWLNGRNVGARYDGSYEGSYYIGSCDGYAWDFQQLANAGVIDLSSLGTSSFSIDHEHCADQSVDTSVCGGGGW